MRRSYILLEVIIAIALVTLVGFLLLSAPLKSVKKEWELVLDMEKERLWNNFLLEFESNLDADTIKALPKSPGKQAFLSLKIKLGNKEWDFKKSYVVWLENEAKATAGDKTYYDIRIREKEKPARLYRFVPEAETKS